jgi:hypothetical protein
MFLLKMSMIILQMAKSSCQGEPAPDEPECGAGASRVVSPQKTAVFIAELPSRGTLMTQAPDPGRGAPITSIKDEQNQKYLDRDIVLCH